MKSERPIGLRGEGEEMRIGRDELMN